MQSVPATPRLRISCEFSEDWEPDRIAEPEIAVSTAAIQLE